MAGEYEAFKVVGRVQLEGQDKVHSGLDSIGSKVSGIGKGFANFGAAMTKYVALPAITAVGAATTALITAGKQFDDAFDTIRIGTGATGEALDALKADFKSVISEVPTDFASASSAIADLNTRLGLTGEPLQKLSGQLLNLSKITETDIGTNVAAATRLFGDWSVATNKQSETMDFMFKVSQSTGIGVDSLMQKMVQFGSPLRMMGFDMETAAVMMGKWEKEGVNAELVLGSLRIAMNNFAKQGVTDTNAALQEMIDKIKGAGSIGEAVDLARDTFGGKAAGDMAAAIREGRFEIEELANSIASSTETINKAMFDTMDFPEQVELMKNQLMVAIEPLSGQVFQIINDIVGGLKDTLLPQIQNILTAIQPAIEGFLDALPALIDNILPIFTELISTVAPPVMKIFSELSKTVLPVLSKAFQQISKTVLPAFMNIFEKLSSTLLPPFMEILGIIVDKVLPPFMKAFDIFANTILPPLIDFIGVLIDTILPPFVEFFALLAETILPPLMDLFRILVETVLPPLTDMLKILMESIIKPIMDLIGDALKTILPPLVELFAELAETILPPLMEILKLIFDATQPLWEAFGELLQLILPPLTEALSFIVEWALKPLTIALQYLSDVIIPKVIEWFSKWDEQIQLLKLGFTIFKDATVIIWNEIKTFFDGIWTGIQTGIEGFKTKFLEIWTGIVDGVKGAINEILGFINNMINGIEKGINYIITGFNSIGFKMPDWLGGHEWNPNFKEVNFGNIPLLAEGGNIQKRGLAIVGEEGPEIVNLPRGAQVTPLSGNSIVNNYNITSPKALTESQIRKEIDSLSREFALRWGLI